MALPRTRNLLFVYGTLRRKANRRRHHILAPASKYLGEGRTAGDLYDLGEYPGLVARKGASDVVHGEVYEIDERKAPLTWRILDEYEGCAPDQPEPHEYARRKIPVALSDGRKVKAWAYVLKKPPARGVRLSGGEYRSRRR